MSGFPITSLPTQEIPEPVPGACCLSAEADDPHLPSTQAVNGYQIKATDGIIGHVCDFIMDDKSWAIQQLVVKDGGWLSGTKVLIDTAIVEGLSYEESLVLVRATRDTIRQSPPLPVKLIARVSERLPVEPIGSEIRLVRAAIGVGWKWLAEIATIAKGVTIRSWHRLLVRGKPQWLSDSI
jgi:hypothetical protein